MKIKHTATKVLVETLSEALDRQAKDIELLKKALLNIVSEDHQGLIESVLDGKSDFENLPFFTDNLDARSFLQCLLLEYKIYDKKLADVS